MSQFFASGGQSIGASASVLAMNIQDWFPLGWADWISLLSKGLKRLLQHHSSKASILWCSVFFIVQLSHPYMTTGRPMALTRRTFVGKVTSLSFNMLPKLILAFLSRLQWFWSPRKENLSVLPVFLHLVGKWTLSWGDLTRCHDLSFLNVEFQASFFTLFFHPLHC